MRVLKHKLSMGDYIFNSVNYLFMTLFTLSCVIPFYYLFINTISDNTLVTKGLITWLPKGIQFENYIQILKIDGLSNSVLVSVGRTVLGTVLTVIGTTFLGYAFSKSEFWKRKLWYRFVLITMYFNAGIIPWYINMKNLGLLNNFLAYIIPGIVAPFSLILFKTYVESIPASLEESADLDGAGYITKYVRLIMPLSKPIVATLAVFSAVGQWNSFTDTLFLMTDSKYFSLQYMLYQYLNESNALADSLRQAAANGSQVNLATVLTPTGVKMTISMVVVIPILCVYPFLQKYFVNGIMIGAVKG
ncbi:carbohydrate ABC transporter permease [Paenibacillus sp. GP183]|uniref:carbohydrate ABC transporter permease n=1 Tax=Paenibacillus sp. GP183 TaxID=1882751 RepID=UPI00209BA30D|nr:carbohydrate ABC transporter permease [Paenibacillus sp. GP183]